MAASQSANTAQADAREALLAKIAALSRATSSAGHVGELARAYHYVVSADADELAGSQVL